MPVSYKGLHGVPLTFSISFLGLDQCALSVNRGSLFSPQGFCCFLFPLICMWLTSSHHLVLSSNITSWRDLPTTGAEQLAFLSPSPNHPISFPPWHWSSSEIHRLLFRNISNFNVSLQPSCPNNLNRSLVKARTSLSSHCWPTTWLQRENGITEWAWPPFKALNGFSDTFIHPLSVYTAFLQALILNHCGQSKLPAVRDKLSSQWLLMKCVYFSPMSQPSA